MAAESASSYSQDLSGCAAAPGLAARNAAAAAAAHALLTSPGREAAPILALPERTADLAEIAQQAEALAGLAQQVLVLGIGGSSLGGQALVALADRGFGPRPGRPRLRFLDNVDPDSLGLQAAALEPAHAALLIVSKSGGTIETLAQALALLPPFLRLAPAERRRRVLAITELPDSPLGRLARDHNLTLLPHEPQLGGRFTALSAVALLPAALAGLDIAAVRAGAAAVMQALRASPEAAPPVLGAAAMVALAETGASQQVLMPYCDRLAVFGGWFCQLWAESLGKAGRGQTPVRALGTVDQHSQLQLFLEGPRDKAFTLIRLETRGQGPRLDPALAATTLPELGRRTIGDLFEAEARATADTLRAAGLPLREFLLPRLDERALGALLQHFLVETLLAGSLLGVSPFGQPAVEAGKQLARRYLQEMGA